ncbi:MAG: hypothetical protein QXE05_11200 [Nitrososphaeria archaeon]
MNCKRISLEGFCSYFHSPLIGGSVVLMVVDAAFTSIGLKLFYSRSSKD